MTMVAMEREQKTEWPQLNDTTLHFNGIEWRYF